MKKQKSKSRVIRDECNAILDKIPHNLTRKNYRLIVRRYVEYCRREFNVQSFEECKGYIQTYCNYLQDKKYTPSTIHTYVAGLCKCWNVPMNLIEKPIRHIAEYTKGRTKYKEKYRKDADLYNEKWRYIFEFQAKIGIRRAELSRLTGKDFVYKPDDGTYNIFVKNGKGGKDSFIYVNPCDVEFIRKYFVNKQPDEKIFTDEDLKNDLNLHFLRAKNAQRLYKIFEDEIKRDPTYRDKLEYIVRKRWKECNINKATGKPKPFPADSIRGNYILRGLNRKFAQANELPYVYNKLILKAVSILILSHFRTDITVLYMLYI